MNLTLAFIPNQDLQKGLSVLKVFSTSSFDQAEQLWLLDWTSNLFSEMVRVKYWHKPDNLIYSFTKVWPLSCTALPNELDWVCACVHDPLHNTSEYNKKGTPFEWLDIDKAFRPHHKQPVTGDRLREITGGSFALAMEVERRSLFRGCDNSNISKASKLKKTDNEWSLQSTHGA